MIDIDKEKIKAIATKYGLNLIILFGSQARNKIHKQSDVDIALAFSAKDDEENFHRQIQVTTELVEIMKRGDIEAVDMTQISPTMMRNIAEDGVILFEKEEGLFSKWKLLAYNVWFDSFRFRKERDTYLLNWNKKYVLSKQNV
jgi:predicted nucleotidyltransferase